MKWIHNFNGISITGIIQKVTIKINKLPVNTVVDFSQQLNNM